MVNVSLVHVLVKAVCAVWQGNKHISCKQLELVMEVGVKSQVGSY